MSAVERLLEASGWRIDAPTVLAASLLLVVAAAAAGAAGIWRRRAILRRSFGRLAPRVAPGSAPGRRAARLALACAGLALLAVAAGRPQQGARGAAAPAPGLDLVVLQDASLSMRARDVAPDRLTVAKRDVAALLERVPNARVAIVAFAGDAHLHAPLTADVGAATLLLDAVGPGAMPVQGTDVARALEEAERALAPASDHARTRVALLVGDGEDHGAGAADASRRLSSRRIRLFTAGVGTPAGAPVVDANGAVVVDSSGEVVLSRLEERRLADLAARGGGEYVRLDGSGERVARLAAALARAERSVAPGDAPVRAWAERFELFAVPGLLLLALATVLPDAARSRPRSRRGAALLASAGGLVLFASAPFLSGAAPFLAEHERLAEANALAARDPEAALRLIDEAERELGPRAEIDVDRGIALFHAGRLADARRSFGQGARGPGPVASRSVHGEGVAALAQGDTAAAIAAWRRALVLDPANGAARHDLEVLLRRALERGGETLAGRDSDEGERQRGQASASEAGSEGAAPSGSRPDAGARRPRGEGGVPQRDVAPMAVAEAERLLDDVAARERALPVRLVRGRVRAETKGW